MINRGNWKLLREYLRYREEIDQVSNRSLRNEETWLQHVLEWAGEKSLRDSPKIRPSFPAYLFNARLDGKDEQLSKAYVEKVIRSARRFFIWLSTQKTGYRDITPYYLGTLRAPRMEELPKEHIAVSLEEIKAIALAPVKATRERRIRAAAVFWWLSGVRIGAFVSLPIKAVDLERLEIKQHPSLGVRTKNSKHATTYMLDIPELLSVVRDWDNEVRSKLPGEGLWFAPLMPDTGEINPYARVDKIGENRYRIARRDLKDWINRVGLPYYSPHKFRHGYAVYSLKLAKDVGDLKAISQNLMHSNLQTTDGIYSILSKDDTRERILRLSNKSNQAEIKNISPEDLELALQIIAAIKNRS